MPDTRLAKTAVNRESGSTAASNEPVQSTAPEKKHPMWVHCACSHEWVAAWLPMPIEKMAPLMKAPCPLCGGKKTFLGRIPKATTEGDADAWIGNGDTGISAETIWRVMTGKIGHEYWHPDVPHDPGDFGRCYRLLRVMPSWRARLPEVSAKYRQWKPFVDAWDELTALYEEELPSGKCLKLYARMLEISA